PCSRGTGSTPASARTPWSRTSRASASSRSAPKPAIGRAASYGATGSGSAPTPTSSRASRAAEARRRLLLYLAVEGPLGLSARHLGALGGRLGAARGGLGSPRGVLGPGDRGVFLAPGHLGATRGERTDQHQARCQATD